MSIMTQWQFGLIFVIACAYCLVVESKVLDRCELAKELHQRHRLHLPEVAQWVCIAQHSSGYDTAAQVKSLAGGSHGLFQISDVYWCSAAGQAAGCNLPCHKLRDGNLSDDLSCAKRIFDEHQRISGDGYTAWNAYQQYCKQNAMSYIKDCFPGKHTHFSSTRGYKAVNGIQDYSLKKPGKVYGRCELARELYSKHKIPMQQIATWVCIAEHESHLNTAAVGRLNTDGSADHGIFQISDLYWCSHDRFGAGGGKACGLSCSKLLDNDITDDVRCIQRIFREHTALSGDGFNAWTVYKPYCQSQDYDKIANCFQNFPRQQKKLQTYGLEMATKFNSNNKHSFLNNLPNIADKVHNTSSSDNDIFEANVVSPKGKKFTRCSLAQELFFKHNFPIHDVSTWVCIAEHESQLNTAAIGRFNTDDSLDFGLFQINDRYWCHHTEHGGKACNLPCSKLLDDDIKDDVACIKTIFEEHTRLSGDGFNAWTVYKPHCQTQDIEHIKTCFDEKTLLSFETFQPSSSFNVEITQPKGKIYNKCELAQELYHKHRMPMEQIPKWVCIAQHESSFSTAAVGRLNADGSADYGLFQISDLYWCSHSQHGGKACNIACNRLLDSDITDDVKCIRTIHEEHTRISGDGFNAWTVYKPHCGNIKMNHIKDCFTEGELKPALVHDISSSINALEPFYKSSVKTRSGKVYEKCELAHELLTKHKIPIEQVATWVCIAQHESSFNTAAVGRLNADGSLDHGLFQISDLYWCTHDKYGGNACNIPCDKLLDSDITDDIQCIKVIYEEHTRISGDGFNAWTAYEPHCHGRKLEEIRNCFSPNHIEKVTMKQTILNKDKRILQTQQDFGKLLYSHNPFLSGRKPPTYNEITYYERNPFLQSIIIGSESEIHENYHKNQNYQNNPFLSKYLEQSPSTPNYGLQHGASTEATYKNNPFLNGQFSSNAMNNLATKPFKSNPFLSRIKLLSNDMLMLTSLQNKSSSDDRKKINKNYVNTYDFRTVTTTPSTPSNTAGTTIQKFTTQITEKLTTLKPEIPVITSPTTTPKLATTKATLSSWITRKSTRKPQETSTSWNWQRRNNATTTTKSPTPSTTTQKRRNDYHSLITTKPSIAAITKPIVSLHYSESTTSKFQTSDENFKTTTENWKNWDSDTSIKSNISQQKSSATKSSTTTANWRKSEKIQFSKSSTKYPTITTESNITRIQLSATKPPTTTENWTKWYKAAPSKSDDVKLKLSTKPTPTTTSENSRKWYETTASYLNTPTTTTTRTTISSYKSTTIKPLTTTENWRKWYKTSTGGTSIMQQESSTIRPTITTQNSIKRDKTTTSNYMSTTAKPVTTTENWKKWDRSTTKKFNTTTTTKFQIVSNRDNFKTTKPQSLTENGRSWDIITIESGTTTSVKDEKIKQKSTIEPTTQTAQDKWKKWERTTTESEINTSKWQNNKEFTTPKPEDLTQSSGKYNKTTTKTPSTINTNLQKPTTPKPKTSTENWRKWDQTTSKEIQATTINPEGVTHKKELSIRKLLTSTEKWGKWDSITTTNPLKDETTPQKANTKITTTSKPSATNNWTSGITSPATKVTAAKRILFENYTILPYSNETAAEATTQRPYFSESSTLESTNTSAEFNNYKNHPFSHPFFAKAKKQIEILRDSFTAKVPSVMPESTLHQDLENNTLHKT